MEKGVSSLLSADPRFRRILGPRQRVFLVALDHGLPAGPLVGIERPGEFLDRLRDVPYTGVVVNPGIVRDVGATLGEQRALVVHLSGGTGLAVRSRSKVLTCSVERAVALGADAVSVQICFGDSADDRMIADAGRVVDQARTLGVPVLGMAYTASRAGEASGDAEATSHAARATAEIGASLVQISYEGPAEGFRRLVRGCPVPIVLAGGPPSGPEERWLRRLRDALRSGIAGVAAGRILFSRENPAAFGRRIGEVLSAERLEALPVGGVAP